MSGKAHPHTRPTRNLEAQSLSGPLDLLRHRPDAVEGAPQAQADQAGDQLFHRSPPRRLRFKSDHPAITGPNASEDAANDPE